MKIFLKNRFFISFHFTQNDIRNPKLLSQMPTIKRRSSSRTETTRDKSRMIPIFGPAFLITKHIFISRFTSTINFLRKHRLFTKMSESREIKIITRSTRPHTAQTLLIIQISTNIRQAYDNAMLS